MEFSKEQIEKAKNCKTIEELKELAKNEGLNLSQNEAEQYFEATRVGELNDDDLDKVAGGKGEQQVWHRHFVPTCPFCGKDVDIFVDKFRNSNNDCWYVLSQNKCTCGAEIKYCDGTANFAFIKNGEER